MKKRIDKAFRGDINLVIGCVALIWITLLFVLFQVEELSSSMIFSVLIAAICILSLAFLTSAFVGLTSHLKKNRIDLYTEDIEHLKK